MRLGSAINYCPRARQISPLRLGSLPHECARVSLSAPEHQSPLRFSNQLWPSGLSATSSQAWQLLPLKLSYISYRGYRGSAAIVSRAPQLSPLRLRSYRLSGSAAIASRAPQLPGLSGSAASASRATASRAPKLPGLSGSAASASRAPQLAPLGPRSYRLSGSAATASRAPQLPHLGLRSYRLSGSAATASRAPQLSPLGLGLRS